MKNSEFCDLCRACFGVRWTSDAERAIGVSRRHLQRIAAGQNPVSPGIAADILTVATRKRDELIELINLIKQPPQGAEKLPSDRIGEEQPAAPDQFSG